MGGVSGGVRKDGSIEDPDRALISAGRGTQDADRLLCGVDCRRRSGLIWSLLLRLRPVPLIWAPKRQR